MTAASPWLGDAALIFISLFVQGLPFLLAGALLGALLSTFVPVAALIQRWPKSALLSAVCGAFFALFLPSCDCAVVPVVRRLFQKGMPVSAGIAYLLAAPCINPICLVSTYFAYQYNHPWVMVALRGGGSLLIAVAIACFASQFSLADMLKGEVLLPAGTEDPASWLRVHPKLGPLGRKCAAALAIAGTDFLNVSALYIVGCLCTSLLQSALPVWTRVTAHREFAVPAGMLAAFVLSMCSSADAFIANSFTALPLNGAMAFLWFGPIFNLRTLFVYRTILRYRAMLALGLLASALVYVMASRLIFYLPWLHGT